MLRVRRSAAEPPVICAFWKAVACKALPPQFRLCHCFALPPCVQRQNHTQAIERKPSASAVTVSNGNTPGRRRKCQRKSATSNHWQLWERPLNSTLSPGLWEGAAVGNRGILRKPFCFKISIACIFSLFFHEDWKNTTHICSLRMSQICSQTKGYPFQERLLKSQNWQCNVFIPFN